MEDTRTRRSCMSSRVTMSMKDAQHLARTSFLDAVVCSSTGAMLWLPKTAAHMTLHTSRCKAQRWVQPILRWMRTSSVFNETPLRVYVARRGAGRTCLMIVCSCVVLWVRWLETSYSFQNFCCCSVTLPWWSVARKCCSSQFSPCLDQQCYLWTPRHARCVSRNLTRHVLTLSAHTTSPEEGHLHDSRLYRDLKTNALHPRMDRPILQARP